MSNRPADWHIRNALSNFPGTNVVAVEEGWDFVDVALKKGGLFGGRFLVRSFDNSRVQAQ